MKFCLLLLFISVARYSIVRAQTEAPIQSLNHYVTFLDESSKVLIGRFKMLADYQAEVNQYKKKPVSALRLPSSGPLEEYYFKKALSGNGLAGAEMDRLNKGARAIWELLNDLDMACKQLETHVHLKAYQNDNLKQSDEYVTKIQGMFEQFSQEKDAFYLQVQQAYRKRQPYSATDRYLVTEKAMEQVILSQHQLLDSLPYYLDEENRADWPVETVRRSMLADEKFLVTIGNTQAKLEYPASDMLSSFKSAIASMQSLKSRAIDNYTFAAKQSAEHGNESYMLLMNQFNQDLLAFHKSFVNYAQSQRRLLYYPAFSPVFSKEKAAKTARKLAETAPFEDKPLLSFNIKKASAPASPALIRTLNDYIEFVNESLQQMHSLQLTLRNYQSSAEYYRAPGKSSSRANLAYSHDQFKIPASAYALLMTSSATVPEPYRAAINRQTEVLMNVLKEMDDLSIELIAYTSKKQYLNDQLQRSDAILDRYLTLFDTFDRKKEQLYNDVRRIFEVYPNADPKNSWIVAGKALQNTMDDDRDVLFGVKALLRQEIAEIPATVKIEDDAQQLIADEYQNLKGLQRYGRSNGLCPYSPYEDLAGNSARFAELTKKVKNVSPSSTRHPFESFYYFYNNELVYQYNKFVELSKGGLLKVVNQPDLFVFARTDKSKATNPLKATQPEPIRKEAVNDPDPEIAAAGKSKNQANPTENPAASITTQVLQPKTDTVYVERLRVDTVFVDRAITNQQVTRSLDGFAANNMVLLLDVSSSMNSPYKMPLLKHSIKSMLTLLRPEDQISIVLYSGKARVVLKPTSGSKSAEIARMIDLLQSDGDTDGNEGIRLAYKTANKQYIRGGNNRIILATDGEFPVSDEVMQMIGQNARQDLYLTILTFGRNAHTGQKLKKLSQIGKGSYAHVTQESADLQLILEAQGKKLATE
ncbi:vWA domain-containing protein [Dyadobacter fanqingshengii]|uniref:VWA domain-containing protein n=1 Tax=Dyadobacter fanqingshengii TaxID=2906443 RepID=A0A9X1P8P2_9BACT|nr:VWA domain-containing protein [Dyadobacter fanqingshengii]MCF0040786.1 VWA domain-containing protein [Dyadobacter fanqingshengii]USJ37479.1 VWA domain-containing protein [Dyadobacter fanqingshengii]